MRIWRYMVGIKDTYQETCSKNPKAQEQIQRLHLLAAPESKHNGWLALLLKTKWHYLWIISKHGVCAIYLPTLILGSVLVQ